MKTEDRSEAELLRARGRKRHNENMRRVNQLWIWLGVLFLVFILLWWVWSIGTFEDLAAFFNGVGA